MRDGQHEEGPFQHIDNSQEATNTELLLLETNIDPTVRTLPRRFERQRRPSDIYTITKSH